MPFLSLSSINDLFLANFDLRRATCQGPKRRVGVGGVTNIQNQNPFVAKPSDVDILFIHCKSQDCRGIGKSSSAAMFQSMCAIDSKILGDGQAHMVKLNVPLNAVLVQELSL